MFVASHRGYCCGIRELKDVQPGDFQRKLHYDRKMQYRAHCSHAKREWVEPELIAEGFVLLATNINETVWGLVGKG